MPRVLTHAVKSETACTNTIKGTFQSRLIFNLTFKTHDIESRGRSDKNQLLGNWAFWWDTTVRMIVCGGGLVEEVGGWKAEAWYVEAFWRQL